MEREYFTFDYFDYVDKAVNDRSGAAVWRIRIHYETFGLEWANQEGTSSVGLRLPINTFNADNSIAGMDGTSTDIGDLSIIFKEVVWRDRDRGNLVSGGLAVTPPTGPGAFAGSNHLGGFRSTTLQPFVGYIWNWDRLYVQGFSAFDFPTDKNDVILCNNDIGIGYALFRTSGGHFPITAVIPTGELNVSTPLNHRGALSLSDQAGAADVVSLTAGMTLEVLHKTGLAIGCTVPFTGPRPFAYEIQAQVRCHF
jgi:hypothetical protein